VFVSNLSRREAVGDTARERGFSLAEALVALALLGGALTVVASLFAMAARANVEARRITIASLLARDKLEQLRAPASPLEPSPGDSLDADRDGFADFFDPSGRPIGDGPRPPVGAAYVRRWSVRPDGAGIGDPVAIEVVVARDPNGTPVPDLSRQAGTIRLAGIVRRFE
jgi:type II secretory pathway pseudopilin PulG